jgi:hypothetical protein
MLKNPDILENYSRTVGRRETTKRVYVQLSEWS